jgi:hypothetical protein
MLFSANGTLKSFEESSVSLAHLVGHCIIYVEGQSSNLGHSTYPP